jgi:exoribonuclease II
VRDYMHSTAPNRRFPDLVTLRTIKAMLAGAPPAYSRAELETLAQHCTEQEDAAQKVERRVRKSEAALVLQQRVGQQFDAIVTGLSERDTWVRVFSPPVEGKLLDPAKDLDVGRTLRVKLVSADVERGFIDFVQVV